MVTEANGIKDWIGRAKIRFEMNKWDVNSKQEALLEGS